MEPHVNRTDPNSEWLEADGYGGYASGTVSGIRTRRYHALLLTATQPPTGRVVLVNGLEAWIETEDGTFAITSHRYIPNDIHPDGANHIAQFTADPWPTWTYSLPSGLSLRQEIAVSRQTGQTLLRWRVESGKWPAKLHVRLLISGRDYHAVHHENEAFNFRYISSEQQVFWQPYPELPCIAVVSNASYRHEPLWYRNFAYEAEHERGLDCAEDLASPGVFAFNLTREDAVLALQAAPMPHLSTSHPDAHTLVGGAFAEEAARRFAFPSSLHRTADAYIAKRGDGKTLIAGYPWFTDWGRDTFIAMRGLCMATRRYDVAREILVAWADTVSDGMLPNFFPDGTATPEYNTVDASLWYVIAAHELLEVARRESFPEATDLEAILGGAITKILEGYSNGTRYGIRADEDGLLMAGEPGVQLTWMDAKIGEWVVTPRIGKPVEIQALWINALHAGARISDEWRPLLNRALQSFADRFWCAEKGYLYDVVDVAHHHGEVDSTLRPNQILAIGGLPYQILRGAKAVSVVDAVELHLLTPLGLRTLDPRDPAYRSRYEGGPFERDSAYHQGPAWPWLLDPFVDAWLRVRNDSNAAREEAKRRFLLSLLNHLGSAGLGHVSELADPEPPFTPRGCPFQAWSLGSLIRISQRIERAANDTSRAQRAHVIPKETSHAS
jgi:predicted glycogen debranching enzyme